MKCSKIKAGSVYLYYTIHFSMENLELLPPPGERDFENEMVFRAVRSSGPGGQNVNKVNTKVELRFDLMASRLFTEEEKDKLRTRAGGKLSKEGIIIIQSQSELTQIGNKSQCIVKFYRFIFSALEPETTRKATKPAPHVREERIAEKKKNSLKKLRRGPVNPEE